MALSRVHLKVFGAFAPWGEVAVFVVRCLLPWCCSDLQRAKLISEVLKLEWLTQVTCSDQLHDGLQVIALFSCNT